MLCAKCSKALDPGATTCGACGTAVAPGPAGLYAGFWRRAAACVIDGFILCIPSWIIATVMDERAIGGMPAQLALYWLYTALMESSGMQATFGKKALGIKVTDLEGERISFLRASGRYFGMFASAVILGIGFVLAAFTARKQALHDMMAGCLVLRADALPEEVEAGGKTMPITGGVWAAIAFLLIFPGAGLIAAIVIPATQDYKTRGRVAMAIASAGPSQDTPSQSAYVRKVNGSKSSGRIEIVLEPARLGRALQEGAAITYIAQPDGTWSCTARAIANKYLPPACRQ